MGMHIGLVAAKTSVAEFRETFSSVWTNFETVAVADDLPDANALWAWKESHEKFVSAADWTKENPGREVYGFWQDGPWAVMMDSSYILASDEEGLKELSTRLGTVLSFVVETAGGCAYFWCFESGKLRRRISNIDGDSSMEGQPLSEESGINTDNYYMDQAEDLWKAFGMSPYDQMPTSTGCQALCVIERADYSDSGSIGTTPSAPKSPWWKFW